MFAPCPRPLIWIKGIYVLYQGLFYMSRGYISEVWVMACFDP